MQFVDENYFRTASKAVVVSHFLNETGAHVLLDRRIMRIVDGERGGGRNDRISALGGETWRGGWRRRGRYGGGNGGRSGQLLKLANRVVNTLKVSEKLGVLDLHGSLHVSDRFTIHDHLFFNKKQQQKLRYLK